MRIEPMEKLKYTHSNLSELKRPELSKLAKGLKINDLSGKNADLIERIVFTSETVETDLDELGNIVAVNEPISTPKVRTHPALGKYVKVSVQARERDVLDEHFMNNDYACRIKMDTPIEIPEGFVKFIQTACYSIEHFYDENAFNPETGSKGLHSQRKVNDFFITYL